MPAIQSENVRRSADYVRYLSLIAIEKARSGHPGLPLGCADLGVVLFRYFLNHYPERPDWPNRDRFVLSAGHGSMWLYSLLHLSGFSVSLEDLNQFRRMDSRTPGHPEFCLARGIETTTGPLGQGFANAVGMAIAAGWRARRYNRPGYELFNNRVFTLVGDGCVMEGISYEAASLAGHLGLDNLVAIYDSNRISIDGSTAITFTEDVAARFHAQGWAVEHAHGDDPEGFAAALSSLIDTGGKPKLLITQTTIGEGLNRKQGVSDIHGAPAGLEEIAWFVRHSSLRDPVAQTAGVDVDNDAAGLEAWLNVQIEAQTPLLPHPQVTAFMRGALSEQRQNWMQWDELWRRYQREYPAEAEEIGRSGRALLPAELDAELAAYGEERPDATRNVSGRVLNLCARHIPFVVGGSADLGGSTKGAIKDSSLLAKADFSGRNIAYGVREHAMGAINNGLALDGTIIPFSATFFTFMDYMKPAVRLAALMKLRHLFLFSHDSIFVGEDGPTHQPIEHLNSLRLIPELITFRPANDRETAWALRYFYAHASGPVALVTTRQKINAAGWGSASQAQWPDFLNGAYEFISATDPRKPDLVLVASGSELGAAAAAARELQATDGLSARVVSLPSLELFSRAPRAYREELLGGFCAPVFLVEAASYRGVGALLHPQIQLIDIEEFGKSAPGPEVGDFFGFTPDALLRTLRARL